jgi:DNA processing protein
MTAAGGSGVRLGEDQRRTWLRLIRSENVGPSTFRTLLNHFGSAAAALEALPELSRRGGGRRIKVATEAEADAELAAARRFGAQFVALGEPEYPRDLRMIDAPPPLVAVIGDADVLTRPAIAVVGSRNASVAGRTMAERLARGIGDGGFVVVSGLARGIDAAAHQAAIETGTVAVLAGGLDRVYPPEHGPLVERIIAAGGAAVSEMPFGWAPRAQDFPRRNRLISGMSLGVVVVEAAQRSGSLHTARFALEQGREVFAVPGSPLDPRAEGCNQLIRDGATLTTAAADVVSALMPVLDRPPPADRPMSEPSVLGPGTEPDDAARSGVLTALGPTPVATDAVIRHTGLPAQVVAVILLELELAGRLERHPGGLVSLTY